MHMVKRSRKDKYKLLSRWDLKGKWIIYKLKKLISESKMRKHLKKCLRI